MPKKFSNTTTSCVCTACGLPFWASRRRATCSQACFTKSLNAAGNAGASAKHKGERAEVANCVWCLREFVPNAEKIACSKKCAGAFRSWVMEVRLGEKRREKQRIRQEQRDARRRSKLIVQVCGKCKQWHSSRRLHTMCESCRSSEKVAWRYRMKARAYRFNITCEVCGEVWRVGVKSGKNTCDNCIDYRERELAKAPWLTWRYVANRHGMQCRACGRVTIEGSSDQRISPTLDHIKPLSKGGRHEVDNVQLLCRSCNAKKHDKFDEENANFLEGDFRVDQTAAFR